MLTPRLFACVGFISGRGILADVGTDHAYLPVYAVKSGLCQAAVACDIAPGPLSSARLNVENARLTEKIRLVLSDGLDQVLPDGISDVVIAGMGGELIIDIVSRAKWLENGINLILQPNTKEAELVKYLCRSGFSIKSKKACRDGRFIYVVVNAAYSGIKKELSELEAWLEGFELNDENVKAYIRKQADRILLASLGMEKSSHEGSAERSAELKLLADNLIRAVE